jgi:enoyl-CoA hydratase
VSCIGKLYAEKRYISDHNLYQRNVMKKIEGLGTQKVLAHVEDSIGWLQFNNAEKHNALSLEMSKASVTALEAFAADDEVRVVVLQGLGGKAFVSGADISEFDEARSNAAQDRQYTQTTGIYSTVKHLSKPTIAMIQGYCMGGGLALAAACDLRFCTPDSTFAVPAARLSIAYRQDFLRWVMDLVGPSSTKDILYSARRLKGAEALSIGLVNRVIQAEALRTETITYGKSLSENAPLSILASKTVIDELCKDPADRDLAKCARVAAACIDSEDFKEGQKAFMEKRKPAWRGK